MATQFHISFFLLILLYSTTPLTTFISTADKDHDEFVRPLDQSQLGLSDHRQKLSHFKVYWHDITSGPRPTSVAVVPPLSPNSSAAAATGFGLVNMIDNPLTLGPELSSKLVGRAQGFYAFTSQSEVDLLMAMNFAITEGKYNGSTVTILGRNPVFTKEREMPVIGGSGLFQFARGYAQLRTHRFDPVTKDATVEYNIYVFHY